MFYEVDISNLKYIEQRFILNERHLIYKPLIQNRFLSTLSQINFNNYYLQNLFNEKLVKNIEKLLRIVILRMVYDSYQ